MDTLIKILVVEDEMIIGAKISMQLTGLGYEVTGIIPRGELAIEHVRKDRPDIMLLDINLKGELDGIQTAQAIRQFADIPVIYLTANSDEATFNRAKSTRPAAFISKPFKQLDLQRAIELTISRMAEDATGPHKEDVLPMADGDVIVDGSPEAKPFILKDRIFVRHKEKMVKIMTTDILYIEADRNYSRIFSSSKEYLLSITLKIIEEKLPPELFLRIHRSYLINVLHVDEVGDSYVMIANKTIPLSGGMKDQLMVRIQTL